MSDGSVTVAPRRAARVSRRAVVRIDGGGISCSAGRGWVRLNPSRVFAIEALLRGDDDAVRRHLEADPSGSASLLDELDAAHLLVDGDAADGPAEGPSSGHESQPPSPPGDEQLVLPTPMLLRVVGEHFEWLDHDGVLRLCLDARQLLVASAFLGLSSVDEAFAIVEGVPELAETLDRDGVERIVADLLGAGLLLRPDEENRKQLLAAEAAGRESMRRALKLRGLVNGRGRRWDAQHLQREEALGTAIPRVIPVNTDWRMPPMSLGLLVAYATTYRGGELVDSFGFDPRMMTDQGDLLSRAGADRSDVYLFSNYLWCTDTNLRISAAVKDACPDAVIVHGGPDTPKYQSDVEAFFRDNPHVDVTVRGEGEETLAELLWSLRGTLRDGSRDLSPLREVAGLSFRDGDEIVHTGPRDRIADLDDIPSPILMGLFDDFSASAESAIVVLETNRGCPYGCTFCDWGSATLSRIRKFDLDRVRAELAWCAEMHIDFVVIGDANFGIFERDVEIAEHIAELRSEHGFPVSVGTNYAKNTVKHLSKIIDIFSEVGIIAEGKVSLQTHDTETLLVIKRKNIQVEKYDDLAVQFRRNGLPLAVELMMGLPGATSTSFRSDLQECVDRDVRAMVYPTVLLPNSPMNDPAYRDEHGIVAEIGEMLRESHSYTRDEWEQMHALTSAFTVFETFGVLRQVATFVRGETGVREVEFYERFLDAVRAAPERYPISDFTVRVMNELMVPPVSWWLLLDETRSFLVDEMGLTDGPALDAVITAQGALLPARDRTFPDVHELAHDYQGWHAAVTTARGSGHRHDWETVVPRLETMPPARFEVTDPLGVCRMVKGAVTAGVALQGGHWEFGNPVSRPVASTLRVAPDTSDALA